MKTNSQSPTSHQVNKKRKYSSNSDTDSGISVDPDIVLVQDELCSSPELGQVVEPKKQKMPPKLKQTSVQSFFGKTKAPSAKQSADNEVTILESKEISNLVSPKKEENDVTIIDVKKTKTTEKPKVKQEIIAVEVSETPVTKEDKKQKDIPVRYDKMVQKALEHLNTQGEGCSKLQILVYILKKYQPSEDIVVINNKLGKLLDKRVKKGTLLSNEKLPKESGKTKSKFQKAVAVNKKKIKKEPTSPKVVKKKEPEKKKKESAAKTKAADGQKQLSTSKPLILHPILAIICGAKKLTMEEIKKKVWAYVKTNSLRDPKDKSLIKCDKHLKKLTKQKTIHASALLGHIKKSLTPDVIDGVPSTEHTSTPVASSSKSNAGAKTPHTGSTTATTQSVTSVSGSTTSTDGSFTSLATIGESSDSNTERANQINSFVQKVAAGVYTCRECGYASTRNYNIKKHAEVHLSPDHYKCPICQELFGKEVNFKFHMRRTHQINTYSPRKKDGIHDYSSMQQ